jgi:NADPH-dependent ferric siderophore reductase
VVTVNESEVAVSDAAWRLFHTEVRRVHRLSPSFVRVTFTGDDLDRFADNGFDQRIKLIPPLPGAGLAHLPIGPEWYPRWRALPEEQRNPIRTYTVRAVRPQLREVDVDMVLHGVHGPASRWAAEAAPGSVAALMGPNADHDGDHGGIDFRPPAHTRILLLGGDETAVPAILSILAALPADATGEALLEVPTAGDMLDLTAPTGMRVTWLPRNGAAHGERLIPALRATVCRLLGSPAPARQALGGGAVPAFEDVDVDEDILWEVPEPTAAEASPFYAWLAGEAAVIRTLRRHLVNECGVDRDSVAFMGYWRLGRAEGA